MCLIPNFLCSTGHIVTLQCMAMQQTGTAKGLKNISNHKVTSEWSSWPKMSRYNQDNVTKNSHIPLYINTIYCCDTEIFWEFHWRMKTKVNKISETPIQYFKYISFYSQFNTNQITSRILSVRHQNCSYFVTLWTRCLAPQRSLLFNIELNE
jgi:hypothetical protein